MKRILSTAFVSAFPLMALAQGYAPNQGIMGLFTFAGVILNRAVPLLISLAVVFFIYEVFRYTITSDEEKKKAAKDQIVWGIVGIFIMVSIWGLVAILQATFGTSGVTGNIGNQLPQI
ncbi:MAG: hypothetical protein WCX27_01125 [Candidatus Paceibacterota bacterium]|jgi:hypothetical protein